MSLSQVKLSEIDALTMLQAAYPGHITPTQLQREHSVSKSVAWRMVQRLEAKGVIRVERNKAGHIKAFLIDQASKAALLADRQALADGLTKPFKTNVWTPPMPDYTKRMFAFQDLTMTVRR